MVPPSRGGMVAPGLRRAFHVERQPVRQSPEPPCSHAGPRPTLRPNRIAAARARHPRVRPHGLQPDRVRHRLPADVARPARGPRRPRVPSPTRAGCAPAREAVAARVPAPTRPPSTPSGSCSRPRPARRTRSSSSCCATRARRCSCPPRRTRCSSTSPGVEGVQAAALPPRPRGGLAPRPRRARRRLTTRPGGRRRPPQQPDRLVRPPRRRRGPRRSWPCGGGWALIADEVFLDYPLDGGAGAGCELRRRPLPRSRSRSAGSPRASACRSSSWRGSSRADHTRLVASRARAPGVRRRHLPLGGHPGAARAARACSATAPRSRRASSTRCRANLAALRRAAARASRR